MDILHGELWQAALAFAPEETTSRESEPMMGGSKVSVVGLVREGSAGSAHRMPGRAGFRPAG